MTAGPQTAAPLTGEPLRYRFRAGLAAPGVRLLLLGVVTLGLLLLGLRYGAVDLPARAVIDALFHRGLDPGAQIVLFVRLPRVLAAMLAGSALAVSGCLLQTVLDNVIASPGIIGVNAGSGLLALVAAICLPHVWYASPLFAFAGALLTSLLVFGIGWRTGASRLTVILAGVAVSSLVTACSDTLLTLFPNAQISRTAFLIGGLAGVSLTTVRAAAVPALLGLGLALVFSHDLNVLALGDEAAAGLGMKVVRTRLLYLTIAALLAASAVSLAGLLGFVGLIVPHLARFLFGHDNRLLVPASALIGAALLLACDLLARSLFAPFELPVGIVLAFLGAPFFIWLLLHRKRGRLHD